MPRVSRLKVGLVLIRETKPGVWRGAWTDPESKKYVRRRLPGTSFRAAKAEAEEINRTLGQGRGFGAKLRGGGGHTVAAACIETIRHSGGNDRTRQGHMHRINSFLDYLAKHTPGVAAWSDVREPVIRNFVEHLKRRDLAYFTIHHRLQAVRMVSKFMARTYPSQFRDVAAEIRFKRNAPTRAELEAKASILDPGQLRGLLDWLRENDRQVHLWALLQGLCGVREFEAGYCARMTSTRPAEPSASRRARRSPRRIASPTG